MINYEKYAEIRDSKGLKDSDIARMTSIPQSTFTAWKKEEYIPKADKMQKIADALDMEYFEFVGRVGKFSGLRPKNPAPIEVTAAKELVPDRILKYAERFMGLSKSSQNELLNFMHYLEMKEKKQ